jgi:Na+/H+ antiporter NhaD/arsenite permease-like protein
MFGFAVLAAEQGGASLGEQLPYWIVAPFVLLLAGIAIFPLLLPHWWEHNRNKAIVSVLLSAPIVIYLLAAFGSDGGHALLEKVHEYVAFIVLLTALYVIAGGIYVQGSLSGTPLVNTGLLAFGGLIASFVGTTGASMLLIRPLLRANAPRQRKAHVVVFFILVVSNCGGLLTPLGDPPLFLGFLNGVPFTWTLSLWREWLVVNGAVLVIFHLWDQMVFNREERERPGSQLEQVQEHQPLRVFGLANLFFLAGIIGVVYSAGRGIGFEDQRWPLGLPEGLMLALTGAAYLMTPKKLRASNKFTFGPIIEVAVLFVGIFITMTPALLLLNEHGSSLGLTQPWHYFWATGTLSSVLDNAPTYLTFAATAAGQAGIPLEPRYLGEYLAIGPEQNEILAAISCGAVFMGANTYIGNGPNFMVKAIAEENGVKMPGFFGYMFYPAVVLIPVFVVVTLLFFR